MEYAHEDVTEGLVRLTVPAAERRRGPGKRTALPFFNPTMAVNRDLTVLALQALGGGHLLDALTGTGALAARVARETSWRVTAADRNPDAVALARRNIEANGGGTVVRADLRFHPPTGDFTHIDVDPFGTPAPFVANVLAVPTLRSLSVTATDTGALCGSFPDACVRKYGIRTGRCPFSKEIGVRALLAFVAMRAQEQGRRLVPLVSVAAEHFLKVIVRVEPAVGRPDLRHLTLEDTGAWRWSAEGWGPLWAGPLWDPFFLARMEPAAWMPHATAALVYRLREEANAPAFYWTTAEVSRRLRGAPPKMEDLLSALRGAGFTATRTHFAPDGFRTTAGIGDVVRLGWDHGPSGAS